MLKIDGIDVFHGDLQVVFGVSLEVNEGEVVALVGANAAGKSSTLNAISGINHAKSGSITFNGEEITHLPPHKIIERGLIQVPEERHLFSHLTCRENLELGAYTRNARKKISDNLEIVFDKFPILKEREKQLAHSLSGGEQQMLVFGRALMSMPKLLLIDEPTLGLAPKLVIKVFDVIAKFRKQGIPILMVEQNVKQSLQLADRCYVMETGRIAICGLAHEVIDDPHLRKVYLGL